nr:nitroreductase [uncultured Holophaga sp.]
MNEAIKTILNRRSTRAFTPQQIADGDLDALLQAACFAPSGMNRQPWHFIAIQSPELMLQVNEACRHILLGSGNKVMEERARHTEFSVCYKAPTLILVAVDEQAHTGTRDGSAALQNILLAAEALNLGSCWIHAVSELFRGGAHEELSRSLGIPTGYTVVGGAAIGYKAAEPKAAPRRENTITIHR